MNAFCKMICFVLQFRLHTKATHPHRIVKRRFGGLRNQRPGHAKVTFVGRTGAEVLVPRLSRREEGVAKDVLT